MRMCRTFIASAMKQSHETTCHHEWHVPFGQFTSIIAFLIKRLPKNRWRHTTFVLKQLAEGLRMFKTQLVSNFTHRKIGGR